MMSAAGEQFGKFSSDIYGSLSLLKVALSSGNVYYVGSVVADQASVMDGWSENGKLETPNQDAVYWCHQCVKGPSWETKQQNNDVTFFPCQTSLEIFKLNGCPLLKPTFRRCWLSKDSTQTRSIANGLQYLLLVWTRVKVAFSPPANDYSKCFVEMKYFSDANCVCRNLEGCKLNGKHLKVTISQQMMSLSAPDPLFDMLTEHLRSKTSLIPTRRLLWEYGLRRKGSRPTSYASTMLHPTPQAMFSKLFEFFSIQLTNVVIWLMVKDTWQALLSSRIRMMRSSPDAGKQLQDKDPILQKEYIFKLCLTRPESVSQQPATFIAAEDSWCDV
uniref:Uncharacterized protein n=1 Tax=Ditylenchus dipsaci TaxID=166011 RepID=A0A915E9R8_9BILA